MRMCGPPAMYPELEASSGDLPAVVMHPELLMAIRSNRCVMLKNLLNGGDRPTPQTTAAAPQGVVDAGDGADEVSVSLPQDTNASSSSSSATPRRQSSAAVLADGVGQSASLLLEGVTMEGNSALHEVATKGSCVTCTDLIYEKARHLLDAPNKTGETPLHCAAKAGNTATVLHFIDLAKREEGGSERVRTVLSKQNKRGETVLHEAIRTGSMDLVKKLLAEHPELARVPGIGTSPLYLAIFLGHTDIAEELHRTDNQLSFSGPDGQNALHIAVLRDSEMTKKLLQWNKDLTKQGDRSSGSTPLHFAASWGSTTWGSMHMVWWGSKTWGSMHMVRKTAMLVLDADKSSAYQCDNIGSFPIHVAALGNNAHVVRLLLEKCPDCAELRDAQGSTFLHNAVLKRNYFLVLGISSFLRGNHLLVKDACQKQRFASIINMQDNEGNTGLHLAVKSGGFLTFYCLLWNKEVHLNLPNNKGQTALDISWSKQPTGVNFGLDPQIMTLNLLNLAGAKPGIYRRDRFEVPTLNEKEEAKKISDSAPTIGIVSVLIVTVAFAAAFAIPGGYRADDDRNSGTPTLAKDPVFEAFVLANNLALLCSSLATISIVFAGVSTVDVSTRMKAFVISIFFLNSSAKSLAAAFAFGLNAVLAPVARTTAAITWVMVALSLLDVVWVVGTIAFGQLVLLNRLGIRACFIFACSIIFFSVGQLWPYVVIAGFFAYSKIHGVH